MSLRKMMRRGMRAARRGIGRTAKAHARKLAKRGSRHAKKMVQAKASNFANNVLGQLPSY